MLMLAAVPINRAGGELGVLEPLGAGRAEGINWSCPKGCFLKCYLWLAQSRKEGGQKGEVVAGRDSGGRERGKCDTVKRRCLGGHLAWSCGKPGWECCGIVLECLINQQQHKVRMRNLSLLSMERRNNIHSHVQLTFCKIDFWGCLLTVSHGEDSWIFLDSWRTCFTHVPSKRRKKLKPYNLVCCESCSHPVWAGNGFSFPPPCTQPASVLFLCGRTSCMIPSGRFYCDAASRKSAPEFMFSCTKRINRNLK